MSLILLSPATEASEKPPSFVILFADDMGYSQPSAVSDLSPFAGDNGTISTPHLDQFAAEGLTFTSWYAVRSLLFAACHRATINGNM